MEALTKIANAVNRLMPEGDNTLYLGEAIKIKLPFFQPGLLLWAIKVDTKDNVFVMDGEERMHQVEEDDTVIIEALETYLNKLAKQFKKVA